MAKIVKTTKLQAKGLAALGEDADDTKAKAAKRRKSMAARAMKKIDKKHKVLRPATYVVVGTGVVLAKGLKVGGIGVGRAGRWSGRKIAAKAQRDARYRKWTPAPKPVAGKKWFEPTTDLMCCGHHYSTWQGLNHHLVTKHRGEKRVYRKQRPKIQQGHTSKTAGRVIVRPKVAGGGRHRARHNIPDMKRATDLVAAYQTQIAAVRKRVEQIMTDSTTRAVLRNAGTAIGDIQVNANTKLTDFFDLLIGLEMGMNAIADGIEDFGLMLRSERGANIDPAIVRPYIQRAVEHIHEGGRVFTQFVAVFEEEYHDIIKVERAKLERPAPNMNLAS